MIPGSNLLSMALSLIEPQTVTYYRDLRDPMETPDGQLVTQYAPGVDLEETVIQPVDRTKYSEMGLDMARTYYQWWVQVDVQGLDRQQDGDRVEWEGKRLQVVNDEPWYELDGWTVTLLVKI